MQRPAGTALVGMLLPILLAACNDFQPHIEQSPSQGDFILSASAALRPGIVHNAPGPEWVCIPPPPDAGFREAETAAIEISILTISTGDQAGSEASQSGEQEFLGRTPALLLARELFFQQCLAAYNMKLTKAEALDLYKQNLAVIQQIFAAETASTTVTIQQSSSDTDTDSDSDTVSIAPAALPPPPAGQVGG